MKATIVVEAVFRAGYERYFPDYSARVRGFLERHDGQIIRRQRIQKTLYGEKKVDLVMLIDFPDRETAETIFFSQDYLDIIPLRDKVFSAFSMWLADFGDV
jgi:uncharacterized protein (DUF1330 family)